MPLNFKLIDPAKQAASIFEGFKAFAFKGNVIDLSVGVIIGGAFGKIVSSMVDNILMPLLAVVIPGNRGYEHWVAHIDGKAIPYGKFLGDLVNFFIVAFALYLFIVRLVGWLKTFQKEEVKNTPPLTVDQQLLSEIRDLLKKEQPEMNAEG